MHCRAARLTTANIAHVIFLTDDVSYSKSLSKALPDRVFRQLSLSDCSPEVAKRFVIKHLQRDYDADERDEKEKEHIHPQMRADLNELDECIAYLGGRLTDLELLARRIRTGEAPIKAVDEMIAQSAGEVMKFYLFDNAHDEQGNRKWSPEQAWHLIKCLARHPQLRYNEVLLSELFKGPPGESSLQALEQAELVTVHSQNGRSYSIGPGRPIYQPAFKHLIGDQVLASRMDMAVLGELIKVENATIAKAEDELKLLSELRKQPGEVGQRVQYLLDKVQRSQMKIQASEEEMGRLKKVIQTQF